MKKYLLSAVATVAAMDLHAQEKLSLAALESMVLTSPAVQVAAAEREAAEARRELATSELSPKLFVSGTVASTKDASRPERYGVETTTASGLVTSSQTILTPEGDRYSRYGAVVGIRIPLFGSRSNLFKNAEIAQSNIEVAKAREQVARMETLKGLRYAYAEHYFRRAQAQLAQAYAGTEENTMKVVGARKDAKLILNADYKSLQGSFHTARNDASAANAAAAESASKIRLLTGYSASEFAVQAPALPVGCRMYADDRETGELHPALRLHASILEEKRRTLAMTGQSFPESGLTISQGVQRLENGRTGSSTALSVDLQFPIGGPDPNEAARKVALAEVHKSEIEYDYQKQQYLAAIEKVKGEAEVRREHIAVLEQRLDMSKETERVARLRISQPEGDAVERLLRSKDALYKAYYAQLDAELLLAKARIDMMGLGNCDGPRETRADLLDEAVPHLTQAVLPAASREYQTASLQNLMAGASKTTGSANSKVPVLGWYAWNTLNRFEPSRANEFWARLPRTNRVLLSLDASQIEGVTAKVSERKRLSAFLASAKKRNIEVGLLLGDPGWIMPGESRKLLDIVTKLQKFDFSSIHLDVEESQIPDDKKAQWAPGLISLVKELHQHHDIPIAVSLHPRDIQVQGLISGLSNAGATEVAIMQYSTNQNKVADNIANVMRSHPDMRFSLAQSIEPSLSKEESYAKKPKKHVVATLQNIAIKLQAEPNFAGIIVQSLDDYLNGALHED